MAGTHAAAATARTQHHRPGGARAAAGVAAVLALAAGAAVPAGAADQRVRAAEVVCIGTGTGVTETGRLAFTGIWKDRTATTADVVRMDSPTGLGFTPAALTESESTLGTEVDTIRYLAVTPGGRLYRVTARLSDPTDPLKDMDALPATVSRTLLRTDWRGTRALAASFNDDSVAASQRARYVYRVSGSTLRRYELSASGAPVNGRVLTTSFASTKTLSRVEGSAKVDTLVATTTDGRLVQHRITTSRSAPARTTSTLRSSGFGRFESVTGVPCLDIQADRPSTTGPSIPRYYYAVTPDKQTYLYKDPNSADRTGAGWGGGSLHRSLPLARTY